LGGALKNVIAIAAGICDGAGFGDNAKSALLTRGLVEMVRFGLAHGAQRSTFYGLAGLGDLITTSISPHGRNRRVGERLGRGETIDQILNGMTQAAEGVFTARSVYEISTRLGLEMPLATEVYQILFEGEDIAQAVHDLMGRPLTAED
jgi:glycerol-3-phosphate dehydrogenase (NAD(P)+)